MYLNKVYLFGNLTRDPELKGLPGGTKVASFSIATNRSWKDQSGKKQEQVEYHNVVAFGKPAEIVSQYCKKGSSLLVEGRLQTRSWEGDNGKKNYRTEIVLESFQFGPKTDSSSRNNSSSGHSDSELPQKDFGPDLDKIEYPEEEINLEDIPF